MGKKLTVEQQLDAIRRSGRSVHLEQLPGQYPIWCCTLGNVDYISSSRERAVERAYKTVFGKAP